jgi:hypothetical protein
MLGNNLSPLGSAAAAGSYLAALGEMLHPGGVTISTGLDAVACCRPAPADHRA